MVSPPTNLLYGFVKGRFMGIKGDSVNDVDQLPDAYAPTGLVVFTPSVTSFKNISATPVPVTMLVKPISCTLDADGFLLGPSGEQGVWLLATDNSSITPTVWNYAVSITVEGLAENFTMTVPSNSTQDLASIART